MGIEVLLGSRVDAIDREGVLVGERRIAARTVLWAADVAASAAAKWLEADGDSAGAFEWGLISARRTFLTFLRLGILR